jgi:membrane fusion protein, multidrug efflux system
MLASRRQTRAPRVERHYRLMRRLKFRARRRLLAHVLTAERPRRRRAGLRRPLNATAATAAITLALLLAPGCSHESAAPHFGAGGPVPVLVAKVIKTTVATKLKEIGTVEAYSTVNIKSQIDGQVISVHFKEGQEVRKGDLLFTIDPRPFEAALHQAQANLARDRANEKQAITDANRYAMLLKSNVGSQQQFDQAQATADALKATVAADEAAVQTARLNLAYTVIRAPIDGRTGSVLIHVGNLVKANDTNAMVVINQIRPVYVDFSIPEQSLAEVRRAMAERALPVDVTIPGPEGPTESGKLSFIDNTVDAKTGTIELKGLFANQDGRLWPGQFVDASLILSERPDTIVVPSQAIQTGLDGSYVFVVDKRMKALTRPVVIGQSIEGRTVIERGLQAGETVVTDGQLRLIPGATVMIKHGLNPDHSEAS